ncbi:MAG: ABC transporter ATP-binding protein [[Eubacterium] sulci]|jgi:oligopeptide ABC transporter, ATP-binding protein oppD|nr:ABC transporter ATP-binding protein [[Eubacterium] sulci]MBF1186688.1 ABC transporter ATP-binding protein [[Eubacterium] sulci]
MDEKILSLKNFGIIYKNKPKGKGFGRSAKDEELSKDYKLSNVSLELYRGNKLGITGSSGGGKSLLIKGILGSLPKENWDIVGESKILGEYDLNRMKDAERREVLKKYISYIPQDSINALNPYVGVLDQICREIEFTRGIKGSECEELAIEWLERLGLGNDRTKLNLLPQEFSGGMRQRAVFVMAMVKSPKLLIADEPSSALDVINQLNTLEILQTLGENQDLTLIYVSHSPGMIKKLCDDIAIVSRGELVELQSVEKFFESPKSDEGLRLLNASKELIAQGENKGNE